MEKLSEAKRGEVKKMSDARLISKLLKHGISEEEVEKMKRDELLNAWAEMILAGMEKKEVTKGYDLGLER
jgi:SOS response regulatory protein OraA/RecX